MLQQEVLSEKQHAQLHDLLKQRAIIGATLRFCAEENWKLIDVLSVDAIEQMYQREEGVSAADLLIQIIEKRYSFQ